MNIETIYKCSFCSESYNDRKTCEQHEYHVHLRPSIKVISEYCRSMWKDMTSSMDCPCKGCHFGIPARFDIRYPISESKEYKEEYICSLRKATPRNWIDDGD